MADRFYEQGTVQCPYSYYKELREEKGVHKLEGEDVYLVARYADADSVLSRVEEFSNKAGPGLRQKALMGAEAALPDAKYRVVRTLLTNDPPSHTRFRKLVTKAFTARRVKALEPAMRGIVDSLIDAFPPDGEIDFVRDFAKPLPLIVIADFLGVPRSDLEVFGKWSDDAAEVLGGTLTPERSRECQESLQELLGYFDEQIAKRKLKPADDFLTMLIEAVDKDEKPLTLQEMLAISYVTLVAGNETTVNMLSGMMLLLQQNPEALARLREDRSKIPTAVEEALRLETPVQGSVRLCKVDTEIAGTPVPKDSRVLIVSGAANRDAAVFADPDRFDLDRENARAHLSFGKGIHLCLGATLSRQEGVIALEHLLDRLDSFEVPADFTPRYKDNAVLRSLISMPLHVRKAAS
ncbi:Cytochrome P450 [Haloechinothrix alba]|uniref:Cytochrome P450 n=1 Tax=Haloechinothrix alba TaxID=664784 RepID=A0A239A9I7_9PSEU|nr:cytochrome P450 [Haloechinothrix alba]SNR92072.1 Cytochrome P450 [Haloechinothrix alba]